MEVAHICLPQSHTVALKPHSCFGNDSQSIGCCHPCSSRYSQALSPQACIACYRRH